MPTIYSRYKQPPKVDFDTGTESIVDVEAQSDTDINVILSKYSGVDELAAQLHSTTTPVYGDYSQPYTVSDILAIKNNASELYQNLPAELAKQFGSYNDFIEFIGTSDIDKVNQFFNPNYVSKEESANEFQGVPLSSTGEAITTPPVVDRVQQA